jgi:hypothetical protein
VGHVWPKPKSINASPDEGATCTSLNDERSSHPGTGIEDPFLPNQISVVGTVEKNHIPAERPAEATVLGGDTASSAISMDGYVLFLADKASSLTTDTGESVPVGNPLAAGAVDASSCVSALEGLTKQKSLILSIWALWYAKDRSQLDYVSHTLELLHPHEVDMTWLLPNGLDLSDWLALYPRCVIPDLHPCEQLLCAKVGTPILTWKEYAAYGYTVASKRARTPMTPAETTQDERFIRLSIRRLVASMLLTEDGSSNLRHCFNLAFNILLPILEYERDSYGIPCSRLAIYLSRQLSTHNEQSHQGSATAILAMVCEREFSNIPAFAFIEHHSKLGAQHSREQALVWALRLMLYYADPASRVAPLPFDLCTRALNGCRRILHMIHYHAQDSSFANLWAEWICCDSDFFLSDHQRDFNLKSNRPGSLLDYTDPVPLNF